MQDFEDNFEINTNDVSAKCSINTHSNFLTDRSLDCVYYFSKTVEDSITREFSWAVSADIFRYLDNKYNTTTTPPRLKRWSQELSGLPPSSSWFQIMAKAMHIIREAGANEDIQEIIFCFLMVSMYDKYNWFNIIVISHIIEGLTFLLPPPTMPRTVMSTRISTRCWRPFSVLKKNWFPLGKLIFRILWSLI